MAASRGPDYKARLAKEGEGLLRAASGGRSDEESLRDDDGIAVGPDEGLEARLRAHVSAELIDAKSYIEEEIEPERAANTSYYYGDLFGDEEEGRSKVVSRDVRDTIQAMMPSIMRILAGGERLVEYQPTQPDRVAIAQQATDYINQVVIAQDNDGFRELHAAVKDALVRKVGVVKWWWDDRVALDTATHDGLSQEDLVLLADDPEVDAIEVERTTPEGIEPALFKATITRRRTDGRARFAALPSEEFLIDRRATSIDDATFVAHRQMVTLADLVAMGYDRDELESHVGGASELTLEESATYRARNPAASTWGAQSTAEPTQRRMLYTEAYVRAQVSDNDDDPDELVKVCGIGDAPFHLLSWESVDEVPFAAFCPDPEPHTFFGMCPADQVRDLQRIKSAVQRGTLDSMTLSLYPRTEVVEDMVNLDDLLNPELGGIIRVRQPGMMREVETPFIGVHTLPLLQYLDEVREDRTKQSKASMGLDADALQSSTKAAVAGTLSAAQAHVELIARIFAEMGLKPLFRGLLRMVVRHQAKARTVRLRGEWVEIDPRHWDAEMDVVVNVALGTGAPEDKIALLGQIAAKQELILSTLGPTNPVVGLKEYRHTLATMLELAGRKDAALFFRDVPPDYQPPAPEGGSEADAAAKLAEVQMAEIQMKGQVEQAKLQFEQQKLAAEMELARYKIQQETASRIAIAEMQASNTVNVARLKALADAASDERSQETELERARIAAAASVTASANRPTPSKERDA